MRLIALIVVASLAMPAAAFARQQEPAVDATKMGVDLGRIKRQLAETTAEGEGMSGDPLRLHIRVDVVGIAPKIDFLEGFEVDGAVPYGPPTHQEVLDVLTPQEYRSPVVPIYGLAVAAVQKLFQYSKKKQCEAEIEEYRRLVMQGVAIAAPRCAR
jgi:hypothetical protein